MPSIDIVAGLAEPRFPKQSEGRASEPDELADGVWLDAPELFPSGLGLAAPPSFFFVLRNRPPQPLALLRACW